MVKKYEPTSGPKILLFDIETAPIVAHVWDLWENNVSLNQIVKDWHVLSWSAKWLDAPASQIMYDDQRNEKDVSNDRRLLQGIWNLLDKADIVITQNGKSFDQKKLNARFILNKMQPPSSFRHIDTKLLAQKHFGFTSNKLEYMTDKLNVKHKKLKHKKFPGHELWTQCLAGNRAAWKEMERYNKWDVLGLEEVYKKLAPWDNSINLNIYRQDEKELRCNSCQKLSIICNGYYFTDSGKFQRYRCKNCGAESRGKTNLLDRSKTKSLKSRTSR